MFERKIEYTRLTEGQGGHSDGDYTEGVEKFYFDNNLILESFFTSCDIVLYCPICGTYGTQNGYSCYCHEYSWVKTWYAFRDLLRALTGDRQVEIPGWYARKREEMLERVTEEVTKTYQAYAVMATLDLLKEEEGS